MIKNITLLISIVFFIIISKSVFALNSASYLISNQAFNIYDFEKVINHIDFDKNQLEINNINFKLNKLITLVILNDLSKANDVAKVILQIDSKNQEALIVNLIHKLKKNKKNQIIEQIKNLSKKDKEIINFIFLKNNILKNQLEISNSLLEISRASYSNYTYIDEVNFSYLLFYLSLSVIINHENQDSLYFIGNLYQMMNKYEAAVMYYNKIKSNSLNYNDAQINIAYNYTKLYDFEIAEKKIKNLILKSNYNSSLIKILADYYRTNKFYKLAIDRYSVLIKLNDDNLWNYYYLRGICYDLTNQWNLAEKDFLNSLKIKKDSPNVLNYLAYGWIEKNINLNRSLSMLQIAYEKNPDSYYILDSLAWAYYKNKNYIVAAELMEKVIDMAPGEAISLDHLGDIYFALSRKREAIFLWNQALDLASPEDNIIEKINIKLDKYNAG